MSGALIVEKHSAVGPSEISLIGDWCSGFEPPPEMLVSEWAELHRRLPEASAARGGQWSNASAPYLIGIMDATRDPRIRKIALMKAHQSGGSEALHNVIGYHIHHDPCPILVVQPTHDVAEAWSKERLADMIRSTPALAAIVRDRTQPKAAHQDGSTLTLKMYPGGYLATGGANTPNTFARWAVRIAIGDDADRFPGVVGEEGDPADLLTNRTTSFFDALSIFVSTPTLKGGRIDTLYQRSDQRRYFLVCPHCGREDWIAWNDPEHFRVAYRGSDVESARLACPDPEHGGCGARMGEPERRAMIARAAAKSDRGWRPTRIADEPGLAGFHLPAMISTVGDVTLPGLVAKWLSAQARGRDALHVFINTSLAEGWEDTGTRVEVHALRSHIEGKDDGEVDVPVPVAVLTAGVDVQVDRFALQVIGWAPGLERYLVEWRAIPGTPKAPETQAALLEALRTPYRHASGHQMRILATCIDSGYETDSIYAFCLAHWTSDRVYATKGYAGNSGRPIVYKRGERKPGKLLTPFAINVDDAKAEIVAGLLREKPTGWKPGDLVPGYMHLPEDVADEGYLQEITAEHREPQRNKSGVIVKQVWVQDRANEALDTAVLCLAALHILGGTNPAAYVRRQAAMVAATPPPGTVQAAAAPQKPQPRTARSSYLGR